MNSLKLERLAVNPNRTRQPFKVQSLQAFVFADLSVGPL